MKRFINFIAAVSVMVASLFVAYGCSESDDNGGGGTYEPNVTFKTSGAEFTNEDVILVTAYDASGTAVSTDVSYTYNGTLFVATSSPIVKEDSDEAYSYSATFSSTEVDSEGVFTVATDQRPSEYCTSSDLKTGSADATVISTPTISFNNLMTKVILNLSKDLGVIKDVSIEAKGKVTFDASTNSVATTADAAFTITPRRIVSDYAYSCEFIIAPQSATDVTVSVRSTQTTDFKFETNDFTLDEIGNMNSTLSSGSSYNVEAEMGDDAELSTGTLVSTTSSWSIGEENLITADDGYLMEQKDGEYDIYLLIGQSNMVGYAYVADGDTTTDDIGSWILNASNAPEVAKTPLGQYSTVKQSSDDLRYGFGDSFGEKIAAMTGRRVLLINNARGGSSIEYWQSTSNYVYSAAAGPLYAQAKLRTDAAINGGYGTLRGVLFHQGENNLKNGYTNYETLLKTLIEDIRVDYNNPDLPFILGEILHDNANANTGDSAESINSLLRQVAADVDNVSCVLASDDYVSRGDRLHFSRDESKEMGEGYADFIYNYVYEGKLGY